LAAGYFAFKLRANVPAAPAGYLAADKNYGVTIDLTRYDDAALAASLVDLRQNGLVWLRQPVLWAEIEPTPGQFNWAALDRVFAAVEISNSEQKSGDTPAQGGRHRRLRLIPVLYTTPAWARASDAPASSPPVEYRDFGNFVRAFATRYGQQVDFYQIWHEPNLSEQWGDTFVDPAAYADLLREAALNVRTVDPQSHILTAALAATLEEGPLNMSELTYLDRLYQAEANRWFDIVAIQPFGLWTKPHDAPDPGLLNFRRAELVRQILLKYDDPETPVWATAFGWVSLPADWAGRPSPWSNDLPSVQAPRTVAAITYARSNWPWLGPVLAARWDGTGLAEDDPVRGFALLETPSILDVVRAAATNDSLATVGRYPANHPSGNYSPGWRFALNRADIPAEVPRTLAIPFVGTRLDLDIERGLYRGYLWVTIDGQPANALPRDDSGRAYVILYDPLHEPDTVTLAQHLRPGLHQAVIEADGGWEQWAINGWTISNESDLRIFSLGLIVAALLVALSGLGLLRNMVRFRASLVQRAWIWSEDVIALYARLGERGQLVITLGLAAGVYLLPGWPGLAVLPGLMLAIWLRPDLGLVLITLAIFFYQIPVQLAVGSLSPVELVLLLTLIGFIFWGFIVWGRTKFASGEISVVRSKSGSGRPNPEPRPVQNHQTIDSVQDRAPISHFQLLISRLKSTDWTALALVLLALAATFAAENFAVSLREWRVVVVESVLFYFLIRSGSDFGPEEDRSAQARRWVWRLVDAFVAGASLQAGLALYLYFSTDRSIDAEGVRRALGLGYGSPNNLALILDRAWPILLAVAVYGGQTAIRRGLYALGLALVSLALFLTFSKGALWLGLPVSLVVMALLAGFSNWRQQRRRVIAIAAGGLVLLLAASVPFVRTARFRATLNFDEGSTGFFRLKLWQAALAMFGDHWPLGVGLDNFLYQYRTRYILPEAWQEPDLNHPHNIVLDFGTRLGVGGIVVLLWLQLAFWRNARRLFRARFDPLILGLLGSMVVFLSHGLVDNSYFLVDLAFAFFLIVGLIQRMAEKA
jgi:O-antigen ligase